jgi:ATP-dependent protease ClpP protease subunit
MEVGGNKRKLDGNYYNHDDNENEDKPIKKQKMNINEEMIYAIGKEVHFTAGVNQMTIERVIKLMTKIIHEHETNTKTMGKKMTITYIVDSPGGSVDSILKFVDFIRLTKMKYPNISFTSIATGFVASAGTIMCVVADKRLATKYAHMMIHELSSGNSGKFTHLMSYSKHLDVIMNTLTDLYMEVKPTVTREEMEKLLYAESWYSADKYKELGLIHDIVTDKDFVKY